MGTVYWTAFKQTGRYKNFIQGQQLASGVITTNNATGTKSATLPDGTEYVRFSVKQDTFVQVGPNATVAVNKTNNGMFVDGGSTYDWLEAQGGDALIAIDLT